MLSVAVLALAVAAPARALDVDKYLPEDTETLVFFNVKQVLGSPLVKKHALKNIQDALKDQEELAKQLESLGFDPLKDLDRVLVAAPTPAGDQDKDNKGLVIAYGKFDVDKFKAEAEKQAKDDKAKLEIVTVKGGGVEGGDITLYKVNVPNQQSGKDEPMYIHLTSKTTILASPNKEYLVNAIKAGKADKKVALKNKTIAAAIEKLDGQQSLGMVIPGELLTKGPLGDLPVKDVLSAVTVVSGGMTVTDGMKMEFVLDCKDADGAKELKKNVDEWVNQGQLALALLAGGQKELAPVLELLKSVKTTNKDKSVTVKAELSAETINKSIQQDQ